MRKSSCDGVGGNSDVEPFHGALAQGAGGDIDGEHMTQQPCPGFSAGGVCRRVLLVDVLGARGILEESELRVG